ncbi:polyprenyl synthetase family protein, partial [Campylobacter jejuni]
QLLLSVVQSNKPELLNQALDVALALEFIHTYSLIHDDLPAMDNADFRRGIPTLHKSYDETTAILVGDALNTEAFLVLSHAHLKDEIKIKLIKTLAFNAGLNGMVIGQAIDCFFEDKRLSLNELEFLHTHKTARLIAAALKMGCEICELNNEESNQIYKLGLKLGLIFQINDDIIDVTTSQEQSGKPANNDTHKNSFVNLLGLEQAIKTKENLLSECEQDLEKLNEKLAQMIQNLIIQYL